MSEPSQNEQQREAFARSVSTLSVNDITVSPSKRPSFGSWLMGHFRYVLLLICVIILLWSIVYIADTLRHYDRTDEIYDGIGQQVLNGLGPEAMFASPASPMTPDHEASKHLSGEDLEEIIHAGSSINKEYARMRNILMDLKNSYPDLYGWIVLPGTPINYPIMQSEDNEYYLDHAYTGEKLSAGAIYADYHCKSNVTSNYNLVIYGHHMTNGTMFHSLDKFFVESFFRENNTVYVYTLDGMYTYEVFSVYETNMYDPYIRTIFQTKEKFLNFCAEMQAKSIFTYEKPLTFTENDRLLTLSTCNNRTDEGRLAIHAILIETYLAP